MERLRQKGKKEKTSFISDVKNIKENLKIREILRTVKMNSSMRLKAPPGSKVMDNTDFNDNEEFFEESSTNNDKGEIGMPCATNPNVVFDDSKEDKINDEDKGANIDNGGQLNEISGISSMDKNSHLVRDDLKTSEPPIEDISADQPVTQLRDIESPHNSHCGSSESIQSSKESIQYSNKQESSENINETKPNFGEKSKEQPTITDEQNLEECVTEKFELQSKKQLQTQVQDESQPLSSEHFKKQLSEQSKQSLIEQPDEDSKKCLEELCEKTSEAPSKEVPESNLILSEQFSENFKEDLSVNIQEQIEKHVKKHIEEQLEINESNPSEQLVKQQSLEVSTEQSAEHLQEKIIKTEEQSETISYSPQNNTEVVVIVDSPDAQLSTEIPIIKPRNRKLSLDHSLLSGRDSLSQSEVDLHSIGKSPLERKSSFFRKKMDSFFRNTTEMFKKQSSSNKSQMAPRRGSMSVSLQSLHEGTSGFHTDYNEGLLQTQQEEIPSSMTSLNSSSTLGRSTSSVSMCHSEVLMPRQSSEQSLVGSQPALHVTHALGDYPSNSVHSLNESYLHDTLLQNRAISMSSGLDSQSWLRRKKSTLSSRSNRVTWVASEGLTNYFRRMIQDENSKNIQEDQTYQEVSSKAENKNYLKTESKGRRLSYQRAVSGEDPVLHSRYHDSNFRRRTLADHSEENPEIVNELMGYSRTGVPELRGFDIVPLSDAAMETLAWASESQNFIEYIKMDAPSGKQTVITELITTEVDYLENLKIMVEIFLAAAHALQNNNKMLDCETGQLFLNLPDIYNANRTLWERAFHPMISHSIQTKKPFEIKRMEPGFSQISEILFPYEAYALGQARATDYLRMISCNVDFSSFLAWCHSLKECQRGNTNFKIPDNRLLISDLFMKPIQRVTKYVLLLKRITQFADSEEEEKSAIRLEQITRNYVADLNRGVKQSQEMEKTEYYSTSIENLETDSLQAIFQEFKDEEIDEYYRMFSQSNLLAPMLNCHSQQVRTVIHEGDLRFKDANKEIEVRAILFTDMLLICKKQSKGSPYQYKMIRPKYMVDKLVHFPKYGVRNNIMEMTFIFIVMVDDFGSCYTCFTLTESSKDPNGSETLKLWEQKIKEAQYTYNLSVWVNSNPSYHISELDQDLASDYGSSAAKQRQLSHEDYNMEREAKERVATMLFRMFSPSPDLSHSHSHLSIPSDIGQESLCTPPGRRVPGIDVLRNRWKRPSTGRSSRSSRMSSFNKSTSGASHDECQPGCEKHMYRAGSSVEHTVPHADDGSSSITVNVMKESESESEYGSTTNLTARAGRSPGAGKSLKVQNTVVALVHSLPDLSLVVNRNTKLRRSPSPMSASDKLYQTHKELIRSRQAAQNQYLSPDSRGSSYPPVSPTRASLRRGLAFSQSLQKPTLSKMGHVASQSALDQAEQALTPSPVKTEKAGFVSKLLPSGSHDKQEKEKEKKSKLGRKDKSGKDRKGRGADQN